MRSRILGLAVSILLLIQTAANVSAADPSIRIDSSATVALTNVNLVPGDQYQILSFDLKYTNNGSRALDLIDYWARVVSNRGISYSVQLHPDDRSLTSVAPGSSLTLRHFARVGADVRLDQLTIRVVQFDFSVSDYERTIGEFPLSSAVSVVPANTSKYFEVKGAPIYSKVKEYTATEGTDGAESAIQATFVLFNNGRRAVTIPEYKFLLETTGGILYQLEATSPDPDGNINPKSYKEYQLTGTVPGTVSIMGARLLLVQEVEAASGRFEVALGTYELVNGTGGGDSSTPATSKLNLKTADGEYEIAVVGVKRTPWDIQDIVTVEFKMTNTTENIVPIPKLAGDIRFDNGTYLAMTPISNDFASELAPGSATSVFMIAKVPANASYKSATIRLKRQVSESQSATIGQLAADVASSTRILAANEPHITNTYGLQTSYRILNSGLYEGIYNNLYLVQIEISNRNSRNRNLVPIAGLFQSIDGQTFSAQVTDMSGTQTARTNRVVNVWTEIPKDLNPRSMRLIFGEAVSGGKLAANEAQADGIIQQAMYRLPDPEIAPVTSKGIKVAPFTLDILSFYPVYDQGDLAQNTLTIRMKYRLAKDISYTNDTEDRNYLISLEYARGKSTFEQVLPITDEEATPNTLVLGEHEIFLSKTYPKNYDFHLLDAYMLRVYEEFKGYKKLIAEKPFYLYNLNDWSHE
jgi:hypothetical protein